MQYGKKRTRIIVIVILVAALAVIAFGVYLYLTPSISIRVNKPANSDSEHYFEQVSVSVSDKFGLPLPNSISENLNTWTAETSQVMQEIASIKEPMHIEATVSVVENKTLVIFSGEVIEDGNSTEYHKELEFDFVLTEDIS